jgi:hypothetical protein
MALLGHQDAQTCLRYVRATDWAKQEAVISAFQGSINKQEREHKRDTKLQLVFSARA